MTDLDHQSPGEPPPPTAGPGPGGDLSGQIDGVRIPSSEGTPEADAATKRAERARKVKEWRRLRKEREQGAKGRKPAGQDGKPASEGEPAPKENPPLVKDAGELAQLLAGAQAQLSQLAGENAPIFSNAIAALGWEDKGGPSGRAVLAAKLCYPYAEQQGLLRISPQLSPENAFALGIAILVLPSCLVLVRDLWRMSRPQEDAPLATVDPIANNPRPRAVPG